LYDGILTFVGNIISIKITIITNMFRVPDTLREHLTMKQNIWRCHSPKYWYPWSMTIVQQAPLPPEIIR